MWLEILSDKNHLNTYWVQGERTEEWRMQEPRNLAGPTPSTGPQEGGTRNTGSTAGNSSRSLGNPLRRAGIQPTRSWRAVRLHLNKHLWFKNRGPNALHSRNSNNHSDTWGTQASSHPRPFQGPSPTPTTSRHQWGADSADRRSSSTRMLLNL